MRRYVIKFSNHKLGYSGTSTIRSWVCKMQVSTQINIIIRMRKSKKPFTELSMMFEANSTKWRVGTDLHCIWGLPILRWNCSVGIAQKKILRNSKYVSIVTTVLLIAPKLPTIGRRKSLVRDTLNSKIKLLVNTKHNGIKFSVLCQKDSQKMQITLPTICGHTPWIIGKISKKKTHASFLNQWESTVP